MGIFGRNKPLLLESNVFSSVAPLMGEAGEELMISAVVMMA